MEDRISEFLYLELSNHPIDDYARDRVPAVMKLPGVVRATWWRNQKPGRTEFARTIDEFPTLGIYEVREEFAVPPALAGIRGIHFRHYGRPGQGILTGKPTLGISLVLISPRTAAGVQALRDWGDFVHIRYIAAAAVEGFTMITVYENTSGGSPRFLHLYELDTPDAEEAFQRMPRTTRDRQIGSDRALWKEWSGHDQLVIDYVNSFTRIGERRAGAA